MRDNVRLGKCKFELDGEPCCTSCCKCYSIEDIQFYRHQALEVSQVDINVFCYKLWRTATLTAHTTCSKEKHQTECTYQRKDYMLLKPESAGICLRKHSINPDKINNLMTLLEKRALR